MGLGVFVVVFFRHCCEQIEIDIGGDGGGEGDGRD